MTLPDLETLVRLIAEACRSEILPRFRQLTESDIQTKTGPDDLVTTADHAMERVLGRALTELLPGSIVVGEEAVSADPSVLGRLGGTDPVWIVDPVDGTYNFARGVEIFGCIVALAQNGETRLGMIHDPLGERTAVGVKGQGAFLRSADGTRRPATLAKPPARSSEARLFISERLFKGDPDRTQAMDNVIAAVGSHTNLRCSAFEYIGMLSGEADCIVPGTLNPWDHAAGLLMVQEAGGVVRLMNGEAYTPLHPPRGAAVAAVSDSLADRLIDAWNGRS